jgi:DNA-binding LacI/PurR family transcriptional regulator
MAEIAALAGVAESTVSRALAGKSRVSAETRDRIVSLVKEHGYQINTRARSLRTQRSRTVEVVIAISEANRQHFSDPFFAQIIASIGDALAESGFDMLLSRACPWSGVGGADALTSNRADGLIMIGQGRDPADIGLYAREHRNVVVWGANIPDRSYAVVGSDNLRGGRLVGDHLMKLGRRRVVFLGDVGHVEIGLRHRGLVAALSSAGQPSTQALTLSMPFDGASAYEATRDLFNGRVWHDAVFAASDVLAIAAMQALADLGLRVPDEVAVIGYDDIAVSAFVSPALTTVRQDTAAGGRALVAKLLAAMRGEPASDVVLPTELIVRRSCGAQ